MTKPKAHTYIKVTPPTSRGWTSIYLRPIKIKALKYLHYMINLCLKDWSIRTLPKFILKLEMLTMQ